MAKDVSLTEEDVNLLTKEAKKTGIRQQGRWEPQYKQFTILIGVW